jgi:uncharacterized protein involved in type VI secretion and phage assembly
LDDLAKAEKSRAVGGMLIMRGQTQTCKVKIGGVVNVKLPATLKLAVTDVDRFLVTQVTHTVDQEGHYSNSFEGIIDGIEVIPMTEPKIPIANPQIATVKENVEPRERGLVKVQFQWQKPKNKTSNWIRVQTPDAGKSDIVPQNRGFVFIPEKDDTVMIGFEYGDPSRPFVMGSIFSEKISKGGGVDDNIKTIITRSGHTIKFDDTKGKEKIQIYDKKKNLVEIDTLENTISVNALNIINLNAVDVNITAKNSCTIAAGASIVATTPGIVEIAGATKASVSSMNVAVSALSGVAVSGNKSITMKSGTGSNLSMDAKGQGTFNAKKRLKVTSDNQIDVSAKKQTKVATKQTIIEGKSVAAIKGSKVQVR